MTEAKLLPPDRRMLFLERIEAAVRLRHCDVQTAARRSEHQRFEHAEPEAAIRLGLPATHEEAFLDDPTVPDRVKPDLIEVDAFLAPWRDIQLEANDELIPMHIRTLDLKIMNFVVRAQPLVFSFHRLAPLEFCHIAGHRLTAHDVVGPEFLTGGL